MPRGKIYENVIKTIGDTPLIYLNKLTAGMGARVAIKHEGFNPFNSVKDRIGVAMVEDAIRRGVLKPGMVIVEPTSGNTGIGLAFAAAVLGYKCVLTMPETMTIERRNMLKALGARVELTEGAKGIRGAIALAQDPARLASLRAKLVRNRIERPLFHTGRFVKNLEAAYRAMWQRHTDGEAPDTLKVAG